jgi:hypothetical protein
MNASVTDTASPALAPGPKIAQQMFSHDSEELLIDRFPATEIPYGYFSSGPETIGRKLK